MAYGEAHAQALLGVLSCAAQNIFQRSGED